MQRAARGLFGFAHASKSGLKVASVVECRSYIWGSDGKSYARDGPRLTKKAFAEADGGAPDGVEPEIGFRVSLAIIVDARNPALMRFRSLPSPSVFSVCKKEVRASGDSSTRPTPALNIIDPSLSCFR